MIRKFKTVFIILFLLALTPFMQSILNADGEITVTSQVNADKIGMEDLLYFTVQVKGEDLSDVPAPQVNNVPGFDVLGRSRSTSQHFQIIGSQSKSELVHSHTFTLKPTKKGKFTIPAVEITYKNVTYKTNPIQVEVVDGSVAQKRGSNRRSLLDDFFNDDDDFFNRRSNLGRRKEITDEVIIEKVPASKEVYLGEQVIETTYLYVRDVQIGQSSNIDGTPPNDFWVEQIKMDTNATREQVRKNEHLYTRFTLMKRALFPTKTGNLKVEPYTMKMQVRGIGFGFGDIITRTSNPVNIIVKPLPRENVPSNFTGVVGRFSVSAKVDKNEIETGKALNFTVTYSGLGNLKDLPEPSMEEYKDIFTVYPPEVEQETELSDAGWGGKKIWKFILVPKIAGEIIINPVRLSYFDPLSKSYKATSSKPITIKVAQGDSTDVYTGPIPSFVEAENKDINYIRNIDGNITGSTRPYFVKPLYWILLLLPILINLGLLLNVFIQSGRKKNLSAFRAKRALANSRRILSDAKKTLKQEHGEKFYDAVIKAIASYFADKWNLSSSGITIEQIKNKLKPLHPELAQEVTDFLEDCEFHRFAGAKDAEGDRPRKTLEQAGDLLNSLEKVFNR
ncbi:MAG: protein BatD [Acidobacteria bacterium]|nr:protein BatD [Acidobacteriota bacterium]